MAVYGKLSPFRRLMTVLCLLGAQTLVAQMVAVSQAPIPGGGYRIAGLVISKVDGHLLARARIFVRDTKDQRKLQSLVTAEDGRFDFEGLPAGKYALEGRKKGFIPAGYDQHDQFSTAIVTGAGLDTASLMLRLAPVAIISGKVIDEVGEPIRNATVAAYYDDHSGGVDQIREVGSAQTDDLGAYELTPLKPGTYFLSARAQPWYAVHPSSSLANSGSDGQAVLAVDRSLDVAYPVTYYADATEAEQATPIPVREGQRVQVDLHLNPVPALHLLFHIPGDGKNGFPLLELLQPAFDGFTSVGGSGSQLVSSGVLEITGVPAGRYDVRVSGGAPGAQMNGIDLSKDGEEVDTSAGEALSSVKVSVRIPGEPTLPARLAVGLRSSRRVIAAWQPVDRNGAVELREIAAGRYEVVVWSSAKPYSIVHIAGEGAEVSGHTLTVPPGASPFVSLTLAGGSADLQGTVMRAGKAFAGAMVVLVPKDPEVNSDLFRRDQSDQDGSFRLRSIIPGSYTLLAIENGWDLDWSQPGAISVYAKHGQKIEVRNPPGQPQKLVEPIEVQSK